MHHPHQLTTRTTGSNATDDISDISDTNDTSDTSDTSDINVTTHQPSSRNASRIQSIRKPCDRSPSSVTTSKRHDGSDRSPSPTR